MSRVWLSADQTLNTSSDYNLGSVYRSGALAATAEYTASQTFSLPLSPSFVAGTYYFFVKTDSYGSAPETSEADNIVEMSGPVTITVPPVPNITISNVAFAPASTYTDQDVEITFTVNNLGTDPTSSNFYNRVWLSTDQNLNTSSDVLLTNVLFDQALGNGDHVDLSVTKICRSRASVTGMSWCRGTTPTRSMSTAVKTITSASAPANWLPLCRRSRI